MCNEVVQDYGMCMIILQNEKRMRKVRDAKTYFKKRDILRNYLIAECAKFRIKLTSDELSYYVEKMMLEV